MSEKVLNPSNGLSSSKLKSATATPADVISGKTFYSGDKTLKSGTRSSSFTHVTFSLSEATSAYDTVTSNSTTNQSECTRYTWKLGNKIPQSVYKNLTLGTDILIVPSDGINVGNAWTDGTMVNAYFKMNPVYDKSTGTLSMTGTFYKTYSKKLSFGGWTVHVFYMWFWNKNINP